MPQPSPPPLRHTRAHTHRHGGISRPRAPPRGLGAVNSPVGLVTGHPGTAAQSGPAGKAARTVGRRPGEALTQPNPTQPPPVSQKSLAHGAVQHLSDPGSAGALDDSDQECRGGTSTGAGAPARSARSMPVGGAYVLRSPKRGTPQYCAPVVTTAVDRPASTISITCPGVCLTLHDAASPLAHAQPGRSLRDQIFFLLRTAPRDHQPPTADRHQPPTATNRQPRPTVNRCQPPPTTHHQLPPTAANRRHLPPSAANHQPPTANRQSPPAANRQSPPIMVEHMSYTRSFLKNHVLEQFFFSIKDRPGCALLVVPCTPCVTAAHASYQACILQMC